MGGIEICEVGPRDGLQNIAQRTPLATKVALVRRLAAAGCRRIEIGSFVSPKAIPQMHDIDALVAEVGTIDGVAFQALVPNLKGAQRALAAGITDLVFVLSVSDSHNRSNVRRRSADSVDDFRAMVAAIDRDRALDLRVGLATAFHCPFEGDTDPDAVVRTVEALLAVRAPLEFNVADTTGMALPHQVKSLCGRLLRSFGEQARFNYHGHDTTGFGTANVLAAMDAGITSFDAAIAGLGGCPFAPGATGNTATEDVVYLLDRLGVDTGIDLARLLDVADFAATIPGAVTGGHIRNLPRRRALGELVPLPVEAA